MRYLATAAALCVLAAVWAGSAGAQDWEVEGELTIEDQGDPGSENDNNNFQNQLKVETYTPLLEITADNSSIGFGTVD